MRHEDCFYTHVYLIIIFYACDFTENAAIGKSIRVNACNATYHHNTTCTNNAVDGDTKTFMVTEGKD